MENINPNFFSRKSRIGFHYYPDSLHYRETDLNKWLSELVELNASWLVLQAPVDRAIPENFITGLLNKGIEPILQFNLPLGVLPDLASLNPLLSSYGRWGVNTAIFYDRPNTRSAWPSSSWAQEDLVERFLEHFIPVSKLAMQSGMAPVFPALEPGGGYWDTAFLRSALESLENHSENQILDHLMLAAYGWTRNQSLNWGAGGPQRWPDARPYFTPPGAQDQRGFRIFDWYQAITQAVLQKTCPTILLQAGLPSAPIANQAVTEDPAATDTSLALFTLLTGEKAVDPADQQTILEAVPNSLIAGNFWLLADEASGPYASRAWYQADGTTLAVVQAAKNIRPKPAHEEVIEIRRDVSTASVVENLESTVQISSPQVQAPVMAQSPASIAEYAASSATAPTLHPIQHYLLLPIYEWGVADWHLEVIRPFVKKHRPTVGFSLKEAALATQVTVVGSPQIFPDTVLEQLRGRGCIVDRISGDGTTIATLLAER